MGKGHAGVDPQGKAITNKTFFEAAKAFGQGEQQAREEVLKLLEKVLNK